MAKIITCDICGKPIEGNGYNPEDIFSVYITIGDMPINIVFADEDANSDPNDEYKELEYDVHLKCMRERIVDTLVADRMRERGIG